MYMSTHNRCLRATFLIETESRNTHANSEQNIAVMASNDPSPHFLPCALAFPSPSHRDATTPSLWAPYIMTQERIMFSNPTPSEPRLSPAATMSDDMRRLPAITPPLHCAFILQPATPPQFVAFESWSISAPICLNRFTHRFSLPVHIVDWHW